ncbi:MAG TPA: sulfatase [Phycisphaerae bacterium]|nr:sulfatase [Phycisphaerae bacterium]
MISIPHRKSLTCGAVAVVLLGAMSGVPAADAPASRPAGRPNIIFILIDDMRWDIMSCAGHPLVKTPNIDRLASAGVRFANAFVTTSLCSPSRAAFLTGATAEVNGVKINEKNDPVPSVVTFPQVLQQAGYETAHVGKWHMSPGAHPRPGYDYWLSFHWQGEYIDPQLNENGRDFPSKGYVTDILTQYAIDFIKRDRDKPFYLTISHKAMHGDFIPAERHKDLYKPSDLREPASYKDDLSGKPRWMRELRIRGGQLKKPVPPDGIPDRIEPPAWDPEDGLNQKHLNYLRTLAAIDEGVGRLLDTLREKGILDKTTVFFASDNGFFMREHGLSDKRLAYEESIRIPFVAGGFGINKPGRTVDEMVLNIDLAPTILEMAGAAVPKTVQGRSFRPLLAGEKPRDWRDSFVYRYYQEEWLPGYPTLEALRTSDWVYIRYPKIEDIDELYNVRKDPEAMNNLAAEPSQQSRIQEMRAELDRRVRAGAP